MLATGYISAALFATTDQNQDPLDDRFGPEDIDRASFDLIESDCTQFLALLPFDINDFDIEQVGMDFYYTTAGHGVGFFDRGYKPEIAKELDKIARMFNQRNFYASIGCE